MIRGLLAMRAILLYTYVRCAAVVAPCMISNGVASWGMVAIVTGSGVCWEFIVDGVIPLNAQPESQIFFCILVFLQCSILYTIDIASPAGLHILATLVVVVVGVGANAAMADEALPVHCSEAGLLVSRVAIVFHAVSLG
jgi:hypothetical protein